MKQLLFIIILIAIACQNSMPIDKNEACLKMLKPIEHFGIQDTTLLDTTAHELYMIEFSDSWTYSQAVVFEKMGELIKAKTNFSQHDKTLKAERDATNLEWQFVENTINNTNFWCINQNSITPQSIDGSYFGIKAKKGNFRQYLHFEEVHRESIWVKDTAIGDRLKLQAAAHAIFRMAGLNSPHYPFIMYSKKGNIYHFEVASRAMNFEAFLNNKKIILKEGVASFYMNKVQLGHDTLRCIQTEFDGQKVTFEHVIDDNFLTQLPLK